MSQLNVPPVSLLDRYEGEDVLPLYTTSVTVSGGEAGHGRASGRARSDDGELDLALRLPKQLGGKGGGTNPEQLFAAGFAACFHGAMVLVATRRKLRLPDDFHIQVRVTFGRDPDDGLFLLLAHVEVALPSLDREQAEALIAETQATCPYSKMARQGISSTLTLV
jgi:lipoyl-dependent peroxiredoxin